MAEYLLSPAAENDLWQIWRFIARDKPIAASKVIVAAYKFFGLLAFSPHLGTRRTQLASPKLDVRSCPLSSFARYVIFYHPQENSVRILRACHSHPGADWLFEENANRAGAHCACAV